MKVIRALFSGRYIYVIGFLLIVVYMFPYLIQGEDAYLTIHDYLDLSVAHDQAVEENGLLFSFNGNLPILDGMPRSSFVSPFSIKAVLLYLFSPYWTIIANMLLVRFLAFVGMYLLVYNYIAKEKYIISFIVAFLFSIINYYTDYGLSAAGIPLVTYAILNLYNNVKIKESFLWITVYALYSSLVLGGYAVCILLFVSIFLHIIQNKNIPKYPTYALLLISTIFLFNLYNVIINYIHPTNMISHRVEFNMGMTFGKAIKYIVDIIIHGQYHAGNIEALFIILLFCFVFSKFWRTDKCLRVLMISLIIIVSCCFAGKVIQVLPVKLFSMFQFDRFYFLYPAILLVLLAKCMHIFYEKKLRVLFAIALILGSYSVVVPNKEYLINLSHIKNGKIDKNPTFAQFYDKELFKVIFKSIHAEPNYQTKVVSVGMYPAVAEFNGFHTLDTSIANYNLEYKHKFREVIKTELDESEIIKDYFDNYGNRCYIFSSELGRHYLYGKSSNKRISHLDINTDALKQLGCQYILSAVNIDNYKELNLKYKGSFTTENSFWDIKVYKL